MDNEIERLRVVAGYVRTLKERFFLHAADLVSMTGCGGDYAVIPKVGASPDSENPTDYNPISTVPALAEDALRRAFAAGAEKDHPTVLAIMTDLTAVAGTACPEGSFTADIADRARSVLMSLDC